MILEATKLSFAYHDCGHSPPVLDSFDYRLNVGDFAAIIGPGGAGKSTIMNLLSGFLKPRSGDVLLMGEKIGALHPSERARLLAAVPQQGSAAPLPYLVREIVETGRYCRLRKFSPPGPADKKAVDEAMLAMDVEQFSSRPFSSLSGGERQRVMIASALAQESKVLLLDEPNSALDIGAACRLMALLGELNRERGISILMVTHDIQLAAAFARRVSVLTHGRIVADGSPAEVISEALLKEVYECPAEIVTHKNRPLVYLPSNLR